MKKCFDMSVPSNESLRGEWESLKGIFEIEFVLPFGICVVKKEGNIEYIKRNDIIQAIRERKIWRPCNTVT
jgi:hypothetical protein